MAAQLRKAKVQFTSKYQILSDLFATVSDTRQCIAASVARRHFNVFYPQFVEAYETILGADTVDLTEDELGVFRTQFSEVNKFMVSLDESEAAASPARQSSSQVTSSQVTAKLPAIQIPIFTGQPAEWMSFWDLFDSLVNTRDISEAEKHYYLRASLAGEALTLVRQLPIDGSSYSVAVQLLRNRYQNKRLLVDTYLGRIMNLSTVQGTIGLRSDFYDPLTESLQALEKLGQPVKDWSYVLLFSVLQKLPMRIRALFEERYGSGPEPLPTVQQLLQLLDEQCRVQQSVDPDAGAGTSRTPTQAAPMRGRRAPVASRTPPKGRVMTAQAASRDQVNSFECIYCHGHDHSLNLCSRFLQLAPSGRRTWARKNGLCYRCLREHFARECNQPNCCAHCESAQHHTLLCNLEAEPQHQREQVRPTWHRGAHSPHTSRGPLHHQGQGVTMPDRGRHEHVEKPASSPRQDARHVPVQMVHQGRRSAQGTRSFSRTPTPPTVVPPPPQQLQQVIPPGQHYPRPRVGQRARKAQEMFNSLRFGSQQSPPHEL